MALLLIMKKKESDARKSQLEQQNEVVSFHQGVRELECVWCSGSGKRGCLKSTCKRCQGTGKTEPQWVKTGQVPVNHNVNIQYAHAAPATQPQAMMQQQQQQQHVAAPTQVQSAAAPRIKPQQQQQQQQQQLLPLGLLEAKKNGHRTPSTAATPRSGASRVSSGQSSNASRPSR